MSLQEEKSREFTPISGRNRIDYMDLARGLAVFGILIANLRWFSLYSPDVNGRFVFAHTDKMVWLLQKVFIEGKFYSIFSLLFGWGIALQVIRSKKDDISTARFIRRRLGFMLLLGGVHMFFIWEGDIVFLYGLVGFILIAFRNFSNRSLLIAGSFFLLSPILFYFLKMKITWFNWPTEMLVKAGEKIYQLNGWVDQDTSRTGVIRDSNNILTIIKITLGDAPYRFAYLFFVSRIPKVLGAMMIGFVIGRTGFYEKIMQQRKLLIWITVTGLTVFLPLNYWLMAFLENEQAYNNLQTGGFYYTLAYALTVFPLAMVYMAAIALIYANPRFQRTLRPVLAVGRTAFTNYVMQSLIGIITFYSIGFGYMEQFGPLAWTVFSVFVFSFQILMSNLWLRYFNFGPIEWIWRSMTYRKMQVFSRTNKGPGIQTGNQ